MGRSCLHVLGAAAAVCGLLMPAAASAAGLGANMTNRGTDGRRSGFSVGAGGALSPMAPPDRHRRQRPVRDRGQPERQERVRHRRKPEGWRRVSQYTVGAGGALSPMSTPTVAGGTGAVRDRGEPGWQERVRRQRSAPMGGRGLAVHGRRRRGVVADGDPDRRRRRRPSAIAVSPDGKSVYVTNDGAEGRVGSRSTRSGPAARSRRWRPRPSPQATSLGIAVSPNGKSVYVANDDTDGGRGSPQYTVGAGRRADADGDPTVAAGDKP